MDGTEDGGSPATAAVIKAGAVAGDRISDRQVIRWERFLPRRSLSVLLVEHDDSTRHIVTALLKKCNYRVDAVADGLKAWEVLRERNYSIDLVLSEVVMPSLSGIGLLSKIMDTEECKNIPVIMMSSHDSIGVVLKCMLKGAVDFLVKPVRKNELRNLWQHFWRRHCVQTSNNVNLSDNNAASNHISANSDVGSKTGEKTDSQSSGSNPAMEIKSVQKPLESQLPEGRSFALEEARPEQPNNNVEMLTNVPKMYVHEQTRDKPVGIRAELSLPLQEASAAERNQENNRVNAPIVSVRHMIEFMEPEANKQSNFPDSVKYVHKEDGFPQDTSNFGMSPSWELSLRRPHLNGCVQQEKERHILNHSNTSAFSRYGDKKTHPSCQHPVPSSSCIRTEECTDIYHSDLGRQETETAKTTPFNTMERSSSPQGNVGKASMHLHIPSAINEEDAGLLSSGMPTVAHDVVFRHPLCGFISLPVPFGAATPYPLNLSASYPAIQQTVRFPETSISPYCSSAVEKSTIQYPSVHHHHHGGHIINYQHSLKLQSPKDHQFHNWGKVQVHVNDLEPRDVSYSATEQAYQSGSCCQDVQKVSGSNAIGDTTCAAASTGTDLDSRNEMGIQNFNGKVLDCDISIREAALIKFRLKRKDRCFEKKVRYHSRKKLAEQRPRVKGQFVRQKKSDFTLSQQQADP